MIKVASSKAKGRKLQQWVAGKFLTYFPELTKDDVRSTPMGVTGVDVGLSQAARKLIVFDVECKSRQKVSLYKWYGQRISDSNRVPLLIIKQDRSPPLAVVDADWFLEAVFGNKTNETDSN